MSVRSGNLLVALGAHGNVLEARSQQVRTTWTQASATIKGEVHRTGETSYVTPLAQQMAAAGAVVREGLMQLRALLAQLSG